MAKKQARKKTAPRAKAAAKAASAPRQVLEKADPIEVGKYFEQTGMTRKQLAAAVGVSTSVIATVQNPKGDRWSAKRFADAKPLIDKYAREHQAEIQAAKDADAASAKASAAKLAARSARQAARPVTKLPAAKRQARTAKARKQKKAGRPSTARRADNRKPQLEATGS